MKTWSLPGWLLLMVLWLPFAQVPAAEPAAPAEGATSTVTSATISARQKEVESASELEEATRATLSELLTKALAHLEAARSNDANTEAYKKALQTAPEQTEEIRKLLEEAAIEDAEVTVKATVDSPFEQIEQELLQEKANLAAVKAKQADVEDQLSREADRPNQIRKRLVEIKTQRADLESALKLPAAPNELPWLSEARRWAREAQIASLRSEARMLDQELLSQPVRVRLLEAQSDREMRSIKRISTRISMLEEMGNRQGRAEAEQAEAQAMAAVYDAAGKHPLIQQLAEQNAELSLALKTMAGELQQVSSSDEDINREAKRIEEGYRVSREKLKIAGMSEVLGEVLLQQRATLPEVRQLEKQAGVYERDNARVALRQIHNTAEHRKLRDIPEYVDALVADLTAEAAAGVRADLESLAEIRKTLLDKVVSLDSSYLRALDELEQAYRRLLEITREYDGFLAENLLWIRSAPWPGLNDLRLIPQQVAQLFSPVAWLGVSGMLFQRVAYSPTFLALLAVFAYLLWRTRRFRALLRVQAQQVGKPSRDTFASTLRALGLTLLIAAPWPLLLYAVGLELGNLPESTRFTQAVSTALLWVAPAFFYVQFFSVMCTAGGVADRHFQWPEPLLKQLRREFNYLKVSFLPTAFLTVLVLHNNRGGLGVGFERLAMMAALIVLAVFFYRVSGVALQHLSHSARRVRHLYMLLTVLVPLVLAVLTFAGYFYTAGMLATSLVATLWFVFGLVVFHQVAVRWLLLAQRRIFLQTIRNRLQSAREESESPAAEIEGISVEVEEPEVDLLALREESRKLLNTVLVIIGIVGFWMIWSELLPAFGILKEVTVWHHSVVEAGEQKMAPVTLADIGLAILIAVGTFLAAKRLPALLEIILLQRFKMTSGGRYTVTALSNYAIIAVGTVLFFRVIGADWSKLQWLFAALGVGIGFGLQEIVANFISGLIILFERPIRVGDVVTVGDTDGVVTRIRIRATTIKNWENQELLVPNKEFITGRLLNWSLSDQTTRIKVPVGVAYGSDVQRAMQLMDEAAREHPEVLGDPAPSVIFQAFGDNTLSLELRCFVATQQARMPTITDLHAAINRKFSDAGICIAFPQRDVHLDTSRPLEIRIHRDGGGGGAPA